MSDVSCSLGNRRPAINIHLQTDDLTLRKPFLKPFQKGHQSPWTWRQGQGAGRAAVSPGQAGSCGDGVPPYILRSPLSQLDPGSKAPQVSGAAAVTSRFKQLPQCHIYRPLTVKEVFATEEFLCLLSQRWFFFFSYLFSLSLFISYFE